MALIFRPLMPFLLMSPTKNLMALTCSPYSASEATPYLPAMVFECDYREDHVDLISLDPTGGRAGVCEGCPVPPPELATRADGRPAPGRRTCRPPWQSG